MKKIGITSAAILSVILGIASSGYAQQGHGDKQGGKGKEQGKHEQAKPGKQHAQQQHAQQQQGQGQNRQQHAQQQKPSARRERHPQSAQQQRNREPNRRTQQQRSFQQSAWQNHRARSWDSDHRTWQQRGGYHGYRIPDARYRGYFGPDHGFRIYGRPFLVVGGRPRFQYRGYWFSMVDPWPEYWANDWYDTDEVYVTYVDNGYYLYNQRHPGVGISISISM